MQRITRHVEVCAACGAWDSFRKRRTVYRDGVKRVYLACSKCGAHAVATYVRPEKGHVECKK